MPVKEDMGKAIQATGKSAPGLDGIPYLACRQSGDLVRDILHGAAMGMTSEDMGQTLEYLCFGRGVGAKGVNLGNMVFLHKMPLEILFLVTSGPS